MMINSDASFQFMMFSGNVDVNEVIVGENNEYSLMFGGLSVINGDSQSKSKFYSLLYFSDLVNDTMEFCKYGKSYVTVVNDLIGKIYIDWECMDMKIYPDNNKIDACDASGSICFVKDVREAYNLTIKFSNCDEILSCGFKLSTYDLDACGMYFIMSDKRFIYTGCTNFTTSSPKTSLDVFMDKFTIIDSVVCSLLLQRYTSTFESRGSSESVTVRWESMYSGKKSNINFSFSADLIFSSIES